MESDKEHLSAGEVEVAAVDSTVLHLLGCEACRNEVLGYAKEREVVAFDPRPAE